MAVYRGSKSDYPNYDLYVIDGSKPPAQHTLTLLSNGKQEKTPGWHYPYGATGGNTFGNSLLGALPPMAANGITLGNPSTISVLTDDTRSAQARSLMESLGGRIIS